MTQKLGIGSVYLGIVGLALAFAFAVDAWGESSSAVVVRPQLGLVSGNSPSEARNVHGESQFTHKRIQRYIQERFLSDTFREGIALDAKDETEYRQRMQAFYEEKFKDAVRDFYWDQVLIEEFYRVTGGRSLGAREYETSVVRNKLKENVDSILRGWADGQPLEEARFDAVQKFSQYLLESQFRFSGVRSPQTAFQQWKLQKQAQIAAEEKHLFAMAALDRLVKDRGLDPFVSPRAVKASYDELKSLYQNEMTSNPQRTLQEAAQFYQKHPEVKSIVRPARVQYHSVEIRMRPLEEYRKDGNLFQLRKRQSVEAAKKVFNDELFDLAMKNVRGVIAASQLSDLSVSDLEQMAEKAFLKRMNSKTRAQERRKAFKKQHVASAAALLKSNPQWSGSRLEEEMKKALRSWLDRVQPQFSSGKIFTDTENKAFTFFKVIRTVSYEAAKKETSLREDAGLKELMSPLMVLAAWEAENRARAESLLILDDIAAEFLQEYTSDRGSAEKPEHWFRSGGSFSQAIESHQKKYPIELQHVQGKVNSLDPNAAQILALAYSEGTGYFDSRSNVGRVSYAVLIEAEEPMIEIYYIEGKEPESLLPYYSADPEVPNVQKRIRNQLLKGKMQKARQDVKKELLEKYRVDFYNPDGRLWAPGSELQSFLLK